MTVHQYLTFCKHWTYIKYRTKLLNNLKRKFQIHIYKYKNIIYIILNEYFLDD